MNDLSDMTDLSFTQTKRAMQSARDGKRSNPTVFMGY